MAALQNSVPSLHHALFLNSFPQKGSQKHHHGAFLCCKRSVSVHVRAEQSSSAPATSSSSHFQDGCGRRQMIAAGITSPWVSIVDRTLIAFAAETKKGFLSVTDNKDGYTFLYRFGWQVAETLIKKVLSPPTLKTKLIQAAEICCEHFLVCCKAGFVTLANIWLILHFIYSSFPMQPGVVSLPFTLPSLVVLPRLLSSVGTVGSTWKD